MQHRRIEMGGFALTFFCSTSLSSWLCVPGQSQYS